MFFEGQQLLIERVALLLQRCAQRPSGQEKEGVNVGAHVLMAILPRDVERQQGRQSEDDPEGRRPLAETVRRYGIVVYPPGWSYVYCNLGYQMLASLIAEGFLAVAYGGSNVGDYLCRHPAVDAETTAALSLAAFSSYWHYPPSHNTAKRGEYLPSPADERHH